MACEGLIGEIWNCETKEKLVTILEKTFNKDLKFWEENNYNAARNILKHVMGDPEIYYGDPLSVEEMFECDVEVFLSRSWECGLNLKEVRTSLV